MTTRKVLTISQQLIVLNFYPAVSPPPSLCLCLSVSLSEKGDRQGGEPSPDLPRRSRGKGRRLRARGHQPAGPHRLGEPQNRGVD